MSHRKWISMACVCACLSFIPGCSTSAEVKVESNKTVGQELKELDEAYQKGIINREEYEKSKKRIVDGK